LYIAKWGWRSKIATTTFLNLGYYSQETRIIPQRYSSHSANFENRKSSYENIFIKEIFRMKWVLM
jgi:hypothetical protein